MKRIQIHEITPGMLRYSAGIVLLEKECIVFEDASEYEEWQLAANDEKSKEPTKQA